MKKLAYALAFLAGVGFAAHFFEAKPVDIRIPTNRFWIFCGYALTAAFAFALFEAFIKRMATGLPFVAWLTVLTSWLAFFFLGVAIARFAYMLFQGGHMFFDPVAVGFLLLSLAIVIGIALPKIAMAIWKSRSG